MWRTALVISFGLALTGALVVQSGRAQAPPAPSSPAHDHSHGAPPQPNVRDRQMQMMLRLMQAEASGGATMPGQDAFGAIAEIVRILDADPATDWAKVDLERLRQHLIDMNEVVLRSAVKQAPVPGGLAMEITGTGRTGQAIRAMVVPHALELDRLPSYTAKTEPIAGGVRLTVVARKADDDKLVARIRGLGLAGLLTEGAHHQAHHLVMAKGEAVAGHRP
jgi:hypothetical protein